MKWGFAVASSLMAIVVGTTVAIIYDHVVYRESYHLQRQLDHMIKLVDSEKDEKKRILLLVRVSTLNSQLIHAIMEERRKA